MLEDILKILGSKHPLRDKPIPLDNNTHDFLTESGWTAYEKLIDIIEKLNIMGVISDTMTNNIIDELDELVTRG